MASPWPRDRDQGHGVCGGAADGNHCPVAALLVFVPHATTSRALCLGTTEYYLQRE